MDTDNHNTIDLDLSDTGAVEDTLNRLIHERKSLENGVKVMMTYRVAKSQIPYITSQVDALTQQAKEIEERVKELETLEATEKDRIDIAINRYAAEKEQEVHDYISLAEEERSRILNEIDNLNIRYESAVKAHDEAMGKAKEDLSNAQYEYDTVLKQTQLLKDSLRATLSQLTEG